MAKDRRTAAAKYASPDLIEVMHIAAALQALQTRAHNAGLPITARKINWATQALGWEAAGDRGRASRGARQ